MEAGVLEAVETLEGVGTLEEVGVEVRMTVIAEVGANIGPGAASAHGFGKAAT